MDTHLRPYFSSNSVQLDIDASLFAKAVESVDSSVAKKLFVEMGIAPIRLCRPWSVQQLTFVLFFGVFTLFWFQVLVALRRGTSYRVLSESMGYIPERRRGVPLPHRTRTRHVLPSRATRHTHRSGRADDPRAPTAVPPLVLARRAHRPLELVPSQGRRYPQAARQARGAGQAPDAEPYL
jgi:hypothetical protein